MVSVLSALALLLGALPQAECSKKNKQLPHSADTVVVPYQEFERSTMYCYDGPHRLWRLDTDYMRKELSDTASLLAVPVTIVTFDSAGAIASRILSDSGRMNPDLEHFFIWGNVYVKTADGMIIRSTSLWWDKKTHKVGSDDFVQIHTPEGDVLRGKGLDANESFSRWSLRQSVSGTFPNFKERIEAEDTADTKPGNENGGG